MKLIKETRGLLGGTDPWKKTEWALGFLSLSAAALP